MRWMKLCRAAGALLSLLALTWAAPVAIADEAPAGAADGPPPVHRLSGVVLTPDGQPAAGAHVVLALHGKSVLYVRVGSVEEGEEAATDVAAWGDERRVLGFFRARNGATAVETTTDAEGRFKLERFESMKGTYSLGAAHPTHGLIIMRDVVPAKHEAEPLTVNLRQPARIAVRQDATGARDGDALFVNVGVTPMFDNEHANVYLYCSLPRSADDGVVVSGPLPAGEDYEVTADLPRRDLAYSPVAARRVVKGVPGATLDVSLKPDGATALAGTVSGLDGRPMPDVNVLVKIADTGLTVGALTDAEGRYALAGLPAGRHKVELERHLMRTAPG